VSISQIAGYTYGTSVISSPISQEEFRYLKQTVLFTEEDKQYLRMAGSILQKQTDAILDLWYNFVGSHPISFSILANLNSLIQPTWEQFVNASSNGFLTLATESMTRLGWTISTKLVCAIT